MYIRTGMTALYYINIHLYPDLFALYAHVLLIYPHVSSFDYCSNGCGSC